MSKFLYEKNLKNKRLYFIDATKIKDDFYQKLWERCYGMNVAILFVDTESQKIDANVITKNKCKYYYSNFNLLESLISLRELLTKQKKQLKCDSIDQLLNTIDANFYDQYIEKNQVPFIKRVLEVKDVKNG